jgi:glyoxylate/hydroxypyruvate reductase A
MRQYHQQQAASEWVSYAPRKAQETTIAVLGLGGIGLLVAERFVNNGFQVVGWSRSPKTLDKVPCFSGSDGLAQALGKADYVISVLPSTEQTQHIFNRRLFQQFNPRSLLINVGRGDLVNEAELIQSLDEGLLAGAVLDVMSVEPLPADSPLWLHPKIQLTPHISGYHLGDAVFDIAENYRRLQNSQPLLHLVDRSIGY